MRQSAAAGQWTGPIHLAESFVPAKTWPWGGGEDKVCGCRLNPSLIGEVFSNLAARCISQSGSVLRRLYLRPQPHTMTIFPRNERLIYTTPHPSAGLRRGMKSTTIRACSQMLHLRQRYFLHIICDGGTVRSAVKIFTIWHNVHGRSAHCRASTDTAGLVMALAAAEFIFYRVII